MSVRRIKLVVSDFHLGKGRTFPDGTQNLLEDFIYDREFAEFLSYYRSGSYADAEVELVLNGDILNLLQMDSYGVFTHVFTGRSVARSVARIIEGHPEFFEALRLWAKTPGHTIAYVIGNHDAGLLFRSARAVMESAVETQIIWVDEAYQVDGVHIEHGQQYETFSRVDMARPFITR